MPQANQYMVKAKCSYGKPGDVIELEGDLTDRQKVMLKPYDAPDVKKLEVATPNKAPAKDGK